MALDNDGSRKNYLLGNSTRALYEANYAVRRSWLLCDLLSGVNKLRLVFMSFKFNFSAPPSSENENVKSEQAVCKQAKASYSNKAGEIKFLEVGDSTRRHRAIDSFERFRVPHC